LRSMRAQAGVQHPQHQGRKQCDCKSTYHRATLIAAAFVA
jgi:hypothetical protein